MSFVENESIMPCYQRSGIVFLRGEGARLYDDLGHDYVDFAAGIAVNSLGHCSPVVRAAMIEQSSVLCHISNAHSNVPQQKLAQALTQRTFADAVYFGNSGAEANEAAIKAARRYQFSRSRGERDEIIGFDGSFHGRTLATLSAAGTPAKLEGFGRPLPGFVQATFDDLASVEQAIGPRTAAIILEPIQGEGGLRVASEEFLRGVRKLADEHSLVLIFDEIQCGAGRTGYLYEYMRYPGLAPDILTSAKGLGGGFPIGATLMRREIADAMSAGTHGSTFGGNPVAMAVGLAVLETIDTPEFLANVREKSDDLRSRLGQLASRFSGSLEEIRGVGLMIGLKLKVDATLAYNLMLEERIVVVKAGQNVVRLLPPLNVGDDDIELAMERITKALERLDQTIGSLE